MEIVNDDKLEAIASLIVNNDVNGKCAGCVVLDLMPEEMQKEVNAPCKSPNYEDEWCYDCPFYSKDAFLYWIKKANNSLKIREIKRPRKEDFLGYDNRSGRIELGDEYVRALEKYCTDLENLFANLEYDLDNAECENRALVDKLSKIRGVFNEHD